MAAAALIDNPIPKLCATDSLEAVRLLPALPRRDRRPQGNAGLLHDARRKRAWSSTPRRPGSSRLRRGVMELYLSDHPLDCLDLQRQRRLRVADASRRMSASRDVRYGYDGANHLDAPTDASNPYFAFDPAKCIVCSRCVRACEEVQGTFALTILGRGFEFEGLARRRRFPVTPSASPAAPACRPARRRRSTRKSVIEMGMPERTVVTTCAYCGVGCSFKAELKGDEVVRMVPYKAGKANEGHSCVKGRFAYGYATHKDRVLKPMIRKRIEDPWREVSWDEALQYAASEFKRIQAAIRPRLGRRDLVVALHQRGGVPRPEAGARGLRQQQRRHLRPRLPFADRLRPRQHLRHFGRHAGFQVGRQGGRRHASSAPIRPTPIRCSPRA